MNIIVCDLYTPIDLRNLLFGIDQYIGLNSMCAKFKVNNIYQLKNISVLCHADI